MMKYANPLFHSGIDVQSAVLHPWKVDGAKNLTEHCEVSYRISSEPHVITLSRGHYDPTLKKMNYGETVSLSIVIHHMDYNILAQGDINHRPRKRMIPTAIVTDVHSLIGHDHRENSGVSRATRSGPTAWRTLPEEMESVSGGEETRDYYDYGYDGQHSS